MKQGDQVQAVEQIMSFKKTVYAEAMELLTVESIEFLPVLIVTRKGKKDKFPVRMERVTTEINEKVVPIVQVKESKQPVKKKRNANKRF